MLPNSQNTYIKSITGGRDNSNEKLQVCLPIRANLLGTYLGSYLAKPLTSRIEWAHTRLCRHLCKRERQELLCRARPGPSVVQEGRRFDCGEGDGTGLYEWELLTREDSGFNLSFDSPMDYLKRPRCNMIRFRDPRRRFSGKGPLPSSNGPPPS